MTEHPMDSQDIAAREAVRTLPPPEADRAFRERLRRSFADGSLAATPPDRPGRFPRLVWAGALSAAASILIVLVLNRGPSWKLDEVTGSGTITVDQRSYAASDRDRLSDAIRPGARVRTSADAQLDLRLPGIVVMQLTSGSEAVLPSAPGRWFARQSSGGLAAGEARFTTGPRFPGTRLLLTTPEARIEVSGTTFAVIREPAGSCVCVLEGSARMGTPGSPGETVSQGTRRYLFNDGRSPLVEPIRPMEIMKLSMLRDQSGIRLAP